MSNKLTNAGFYVLKSFKIRPLLASQQRTDGSMPGFVEVNNTITHWSISESMNSPFIQGSAVISESDNLLEDVPMIGEEECIITYEDFYGDIVTSHFFIYAIEDLKPSPGINDRMMSYTIKFCSQQKLFSDQREVRKSYANAKISDIVKEVYDSYFLTGNKEIDKELIVEETTGEQTLVIPNLRPDSAMQFLSRRAYSNESKSSLFKFFETRDRYYFCTHEWLIKNKVDFEGISENARNRLIFMYSTVDNNTGDGQQRAQQSVATIEYGTKVDTFADIKNGGYRRTITELDIAHRTRITRTFDYAAEFEDFEAPSELKLTHSKDFVNSFLSTTNAPETVLMTDFPQIGMNEGQNAQRKPYQHFYENYTTKPIVDYHMNRNAFSIEIFGRIHLYPGDVIDLDLYKFSTTVASTREVDHERSGKYLVTSIGHSFAGDDYKQTLIITKGGLAK